MTSRSNFVGQIQRPGQRPENIELVVNQRPELTQAEISSNIETVDSRYEVGNVLRYFIAPNDSTQATANSLALQRLLDPTTTGITGRVYFPNTTGADTYYFDDFIEIRDGVRLDLNGCELDFTRTYVAADDFKGFLAAIRDVTIENGSINVDYDGSTGTNAGMALRLGSRVGYPFGTFTGGIEDEDLTVPQGNMALRNLRITTNNTNNRAILMFGGIVNFIAENIEIDGSSEAIEGVYYEFGNHHFETTVANRTSSHAYNMVFRNIRVDNMKKTFGSGAGLALIGAASASVDGLFVDGAHKVFEFRPGEALFYNVGAPWIPAVKTRHITLQNINGQDITNAGMLLTGSESASGGYLSGESLSEAEQTDLMSFSVDGFAIDADGFGIQCSGPLSLRNGTLQGSSTSGQIALTDECVRFEIDNVDVLDSSGLGIRANFGSAIWSTARLKIGSIRNCLVAGNTGAGITLGNCESVLIENCLIGYDSLYHEANETTQTNGVNVTTTANGVVCRGNRVKTSGGAVAYAHAGTGSRGCAIENARGTITDSGNWMREGMDFENSANIADSSAAINTTDKFEGKRCWDTSNDRMMVALGSGATAGWERADGGATVTPS